MAHGLSSIDWQAPWLLPWRERGQSIAQQVKQGASVEQACNASLEGLKRQLTTQPQSSRAICDVQFVPQSALPDDQAYEQFIFDTQSVPTRNHLGCKMALGLGSRTIGPQGRLYFKQHKDTWAKKATGMRIDTPRASSINELQTRRNSTSSRSATNASNA